VRDDGIAIYLNGGEIVRDNLIPGADHATFASSLMNGFSEYQWRYFEIDRKTLRSDNLIAAEVHQRSPQSGQSTDLVFQLMLSIKVRE
jgi:hypothetical protein